MHLLRTVMLCKNLTVEYHINQLLGANTVCGFLDGQVKRKAPRTVPATVDAIIYHGNETSCHDGAFENQLTHGLRANDELTQRHRLLFEKCSNQLFACCKDAPSHQKPPLFEPLWRSMVLV